MHGLGTIVALNEKLHREHTSTSSRFTHISTRELNLLLRNAEANGFGSRPHAKAYRAELARRENGE
jgi:hypothetical protein